MKKEFIICFISTFIIASLFAINPSKVYYLTPDSLNLKYVDNYILTSDNASLHEWDITPKVDTSEIIIFVGSDAGNMGSNLYCANSFLNNGYHVILFDYRGFGSSSLFNIDRNRLFYNEFTKDLEAVLKNTNEQYPNRKIGIYAQSMGTIITILVSERAKIDFIIFDGFIISPSAHITKIKALYLVDCSLPAEFDEANFQILLGRLDTQVFIFQGKYDAMCLVEEAEKFCLSKVGRKYYAFNGGHLESFRTLTKNELGDISIEKINLFLRSSN